MKWAIAFYVPKELNTVLLMKAFYMFSRLLIRFRYPVSLPEDVASALGIKISNSLSFKEFVKFLACPGCRPTKLAKYMPREKAEEAFQSALRKEHFSHISLFSYYFNNSWLEFVLQFDDQSRLRRVYLHHKDLPDHDKIEIPLFFE